MWMTRSENKGKRILSVLLMVCMIVQLVGWDLSSFQAFAEENSRKPIGKTITVSEKEILKAVKAGSGESPELNEKILPYAGPQKEMARDHLESILSQAVIVKQKDLGGNCSAIVAVELSEDSEAVLEPTGSDALDEADGAERMFRYEKILMIGLNGNRDRDCEFTLEITNAEGIVVEEMTMTGYRQDWGLASDSNALATSSNAAQTASDAADPNEVEDDLAYLFVEDYTLTYGQEDAVKLMVEKKESFEQVVLLRAGEDEEEVEEDVAPKMAVRAGGFSVTELHSEIKSGTIGKVAEVGVYVNEDIWNEEAKQFETKSGELFAIYAKASYSAVDSSNISNAFFAIQFDTEEKDLLIGPEDSEGARPVENLEDPEEWEEIKALLNSNDNYPSFSEEDQWLLITIESFRFYYSPKQMLAVFSLQNDNGQSGSSVNGIPFRFRFPNGITPDGAMLTAVPGVLNEKELKEDYVSHSPGADAEGKIQIGEPLDVRCNAAFQWNAVTKEQSNTSLDNLNQQANGLSKDIVYSIKASPQYGSDKTVGVIYTKAYTISDTMLFENFYIDSTKYEIKDSLEVQGSTKIEGELYLQERGTQNWVKLLGLDLPVEAMEKNVAEVIYDPTDSTKIIGIKLEYTIKNNTLDGSDPTDLVVKSKDGKDYVRMWFNIGGLRTNGLLKFPEGATELPKVTNQVSLDAYSIMHEGEDYPAESGTELVENTTYHHSYAEVSAEASEAHLITKKAYRKYENGSFQEEAVGDMQVFGPGYDVYYQITVSNFGYNTTKFKVKDQVPNGLDFDKVELVNLKINGANVAAPETVRESADKMLSWDEIEIPAGQSAVLCLKGTTKSAEDFKKEGISTRLDNKAQLFVSGNDENKLGEAEATVFVKVNALTADEISFTKGLQGNNGNLTIGDTVKYALTAELTDRTLTPQNLTMTDHWPQQLTLTEISQIPSGVTVELKNSKGNVIAEYKSGTVNNASATVPSAFGLNGIKMTNDQVKEIADIVIKDVLVSGQTEKQVILTGKINNGGEIENKADISGEGFPGKPADPVKIVSLAMKIEKKAYRIKSEDSGKITEENSLTIPVNEKVTFSEGDVVCYEVKVTNTGSEDQAAISPVITDNLSGLFKLGVPELAEATLDGKRGSVFHRRENGEWKTIAVENGNITLDLKGSPLPAGNKTETIRIYVKVQDGAVGLVPQTYTNKAKAQLNLGENSYPIEASASITTLKSMDQTASIEKEVLAVGQSFERTGGSAYLKGAKWNNDEVFGTAGAGYVPGETMLTVGTGDYVFYRVKIHNESKNALRIYEIEDWLPDGMEFTAFYTFHPNQRTDKEAGKWGVVGVSDTLYLGGNQWSPTFMSDNTNRVFYEDSLKQDYRTDYDVTVRHQTPHTSLNDRVYRARMYGDKDSAELAIIQPDRTLVFGIVAKVTGTFETETILENKAGFVTDSSVKKGSTFSDCAEIARPEDLKGMTKEVGGKTYTSESYKAFTASASVKTSSYTPGIEKTLSQYYASGQWNDYDPQNPSAYFTPTDLMRWSITLKNGMNSTSTAGPIEAYTVSDTLPLGFAYNGDSAGGNKIILSNGNAVNLPEPETFENEEGKTVVRWKVEKDGNSYKITGNDPENPLVTTSNLSIPANGFIRLQIETKPAGNAGLRYGTYENRADLVPAEKYAYIRSCDGVIEGSGGDRTIYGTATINIFGSGRTEAWKEISGSYNGNGASASGKSSDNYIYSDAGGIVTYQLNVQNQATGTVRDLVLMDRLPAVGDNGLVNNSKRYSDFALRFADDVNMKVSIRETDGSVAGVNERILDSTLYEVYFAKWSDLAKNGSALSDAQWRVESHNDGWNKTMTADSDSIRIEITKPEVLSELGKDKILTVSFDAVVPEAHELKNLDTAIAWNTFGYSYEISGTAGSAGAQFMTVEPAKVGVKIPTAQLQIKKEVNSDVAGDDTRAFSFILEKKASDSLLTKWVPVEGLKYSVEGKDFYTGHVGTEAESLEPGEFQLKKDQTAIFNVLAGGEYRVKELDAEGFVVTVRPFTNTNNGPAEAYNQNQPPSVHAEKDETYFCTFINTKKSLVLPETGGMGTGGFHMAGGSMILLAFLMILGCWFCEFVKVWKKEEDYNEYV